MFLNIGSKIVSIIEAIQSRNRLKANGPMGDFYRAGGDLQLYSHLPISDRDLVLDVGAYHGRWTSEILARYGCRSEIFEPVPEFSQICREYYKFNSRVRVHSAALGGKAGRITLSLSGVGTSAFLDGGKSGVVDAEVVDVVEYIKSLLSDGCISGEPDCVGCIKINIEGGEYDVLDAIIDNKMMEMFRVILVQFHSQPAGWEERYKRISSEMNKTHFKHFSYDLIWERWDAR